MNDKLSIDKCRNLIDNSQGFSDSQIEQFRDRAYMLANLIVDSFQKLKASVIKRFQTISAKACIAKPKDLL